MQPPTVREVTKRLAADGWVHDRTRGDHAIYAKGGKIIPVPGKPGDHLARGTWSNIKSLAGW